MMQLANVVDADQTVTNSATLVTVPQLTLPIGINERVIFRAIIFYTSTATGDLKYRVDVPASPTLYRLATENTASDVAAEVTSVITSEADSTALLASGTNGVVRLTGVLSNGSTVGNVIFQFAQNTATASESAIIRAGSFLEYRKF
jgi:hypothetical protein